MYQDDLIYDVGMFDGGDTAYYLHKGYRVVAIEANPTWAEEARERFADAVQDGRLTILNVAIGSEEGVAELVVNEQQGDWTTLNKTTASWWGDMPTRTIEVRTARFRDILDEYGVPFYLKVDIELNDHYCLEDLDPDDLPRYVSFEETGIQDLVTMHAKGYDAFKIIRQNDFRQIYYNPDDVRAALRRRWTGRPALLRALGLAERLKSRAGRRDPGVLADQPVRDNDWTFHSGSSAGPFGEDTDGPWRSFEETMMTRFGYDRGLIPPDRPGLAKWHDVHCRTSK